jgi:hypothetical protein
LPRLSHVGRRTRRIYRVSSREDLVVLALRVLPEKLREWLQAKRDRPEKEKKGADPSDATREHPGPGDGR